MNSIWVVVTYGLAVTSAFLLLHFFHMRHWYWHALSIATAIGLGVIKMPEQWTGPTLDLTVGFFFVFLAVWGFAAPFFRHPHRHDRHATSRG
jgi:hypothetical protein